MKKLLLSVLTISIFVLSAQAQNDTIWRKGGIIGLNFNQVSLSNWAAGGDNAFSGNVLLSLYANYKKDKWAWDNTGDFAFGGTKQGKQEVRKTDDKIDINSKIGYDLGKNFYISYLFGFKTQFTEGFEYGDYGRHRISNFLTPGYILNSVGIDWKPNPDLSLFLSPLTAKTTIVNDQTLVDAAEAANIALYGVDPGKKSRTEIGAYFAAKYQKKLMENIVFNTKLELFSSYTNNPQNLDVNWEVIIAMKVNKFINAIVTTQLLYDNDVFVPKSDVNAPAGPGTQFKETFGIGFSYKFEGFGIK